MSADVDGKPLWFESEDVALIPSPEAFASAMLIPSMARGTALEMEDPLNPVWRENSLRAMAVFKRWWGYPEILVEFPRLAPGDARPGEGTRYDPQPEPARVEKTALCFSGGVDSFHTLLRSGWRVHYLVYALGFDILLGDEARFRAFEPSVRAVAAETGAAPVIIRTNLREHPAYSQVSWERTHGGALAAVGHLLSAVAGRLLISSSFPYTMEWPWGSSWLTDRHWSSDRLEVIHYGADRLRQQKLQAIAREPLVQSHLRVCWENKAPTGNCSRCDKCVRTRLTLADCGALANYPGFEGAESLARHIDALPSVKRIRKVLRELADSERLALEIRSAVKRLIARSEPGGSVLRKYFSWTRR